MQNFMPCNFCKCSLTIPSSRLWQSLPFPGSIKPHQSYRTAVLYLCGASERARGSMTQFLVSELSKGTSVMVSSWRGCSSLEPELSSTDWMEKLVSAFTVAFQFENASERRNAFIMCTFIYFPHNS